MCETPADGKASVACIYLNYKEKDTQSTVSLVAAVWRQLVQRLGVISNDVNVLYSNHVKRDVRGFGTTAAPFIIIMPKTYPTP